MPVLAARVVDVRLGLHPDFTRVVVETDAPTSYEIEVSTEGRDSEIRILLGAESVPRVARPPGARMPMAEIRPLPGGGSLVQIRVSGPVVHRLRSALLGLNPGDAITDRLSRNI